MTAPLPSRAAIALLPLLLLLAALRPLAPAGAAAAQEIVVRGVVRGPAAQPVAQAEVLVNDSLRARTDSAGRFAVGGLSAGEVELVVRRVGFLPLAIPLTLATARSRTLAIELAPLPYALEPVIVSASRRGLFGQVVAEGGAPLPGAEVIVAGAGRPVTTGADGGFAILGLAGETYLVMVRREGYHAAQFSVSLPPDAGQEVRVELDLLPGSLTGGARRIASGYSTVDAGRLRDLDRRVRVNRPVVIPRTALAPGGKRDIAEVLARDALQGRHRVDRPSSIDPAGTASEMLPPPEATISTWARGGEGACYFLDGAWALDQGMARTTPAEWVELVEIARDDLTGTLRSRLPPGMVATDCRLWVVLWLRR